MKFYPLLAVAVFVVAGPLGISEAYSPFGGYNRAMLGNVWVRADSASPSAETNEQRMTGAKRPADSPIRHSALAFGKRADDSDSEVVERRAFHSGLPFGKRTAMDRRGIHTALPFGKRTAMDRRGIHSALPFGKREEEEAERDALMERRGFNSALMFDKRIHSALPFGKRGYHSALPFGKRSGSEEEGATMDRRGYHSGLPFGKRSGIEEEGTTMDRRGYHSGLPFGKREDGTDAAVSDILSQLRSDD
ncbi:uncharacterized protein LOC110981679 [Acanthaster planci]|uniref:Uncharacterized protein LOC110981679 n=1 Tax=Acanthaster planci TaxID=133434 RepID=A0A8B7YV03_ACAPL|nr:uncharacterized protein LOC110981679 [Acanthaster planci]